MFVFWWNVLHNLEKVIIVYSHIAQKMIKDGIYNKIKNDKNTEYNNNCTMYGTLSGTMLVWIVACRLKLPFILV